MRSTLDPSPRPSGAPAAMQRGPVQGFNTNHRKGCTKGKASACGLSAQFRRVLAGASEASDPAGQQASAGPRPYRQQQGRDGWAGVPSLSLSLASGKGKRGGAGTSLQGTRRSWATHP
jgi:hypothetical protein